MKLLLILLMAFNLCENAKEKRSYHTIKEFKSEHHCLGNGRYKGRCDGYVIDHVKPLHVVGLILQRICNGRLCKKLGLKIDGNVSIVN